MASSHLKSFYRKIFPKKSEIDFYRKKGVKIGKSCSFYNVCIDSCFPHLIKIGDNVTITHATLVAHDASTKRELGYSRVGIIEIGNNVFIGWGSIILGNTRIGNNVIIGAGTVVSRDIPDNVVVAGNPAAIICTYEHYINKHGKLLNEKPVSNIIFYNKKKEEKDFQYKQLLTYRGGYDL